MFELYKTYSFYTYISKISGTQISIRNKINANFLYNSINLSQVMYNSLLYSESQ